MSKTAILCFYQVKHANHGASEVSLGIFNHWPSKKKKLFELKDWHTYVSQNYKVQLFFQYINSYFIKPFAILLIIIKVLKYLQKKDNNFVIIEGASWIGFSYLTIKIIKFFRRKTKIFYHSHNVEYDIRKKKNSIIITLVSKILEKKVFQISDYTSVVSTLDALRIKYLYNIKPLIFENGVDIQRLKINKKFRKKFFNKYIIYSGSYSYKPNKFAIDYLINKVMPYFRKSNYNIDLVLTGKSFPNPLDKIDIICKKNLKKNILNYYIKKSYFTILPLQQAPGTKIKVIENLILGKTIIGTKFAFRGIKIMRNSKNIIIYKSFSDLCKKVNFFIKNEKIINQKILATKNFYVKNYSISNIIKKFIYENKINFI
jgi:hypothetical protein